MKILVLGSNGFIGKNLVDHLKRSGHFVVGSDIKIVGQSLADLDIQGDARDERFIQGLIGSHDFDRIYQFAANMGGAGFIFTGDNDLDIMRDNLRMNLNVVTHAKCPVIFSSSACVYPQHNQDTVEGLVIDESSAYPADPGSEYGWEKLTSERLYLTSNRNNRTKHKVVRIHGTYGPFNSYDDGKEKAPAALCRKAMRSDEEVEVWGSGKQTRSFLYIDDLLHALDEFVTIDHSGPMNIGSEEMVSINELAQIAIDISGKNLKIKNIPGPIGVNARISDNTLAYSLLKWRPKVNLKEGMEKMYAWIKAQEDLLHME